LARPLRVAAAQMGPNQKAAPAAEIVGRMLRLMDEAIAEGAHVVAYPELALTPYFPQRVRDDVEQFFATEVPPPPLVPLIERARHAGLVWYTGFAERDGRHGYNSAILVDETGAVRGKYRKIHLPGTTHPDGVAGRSYEPRYFEPGDTGYQVVATRRARIGLALCQDRRYSETYRCLGLGGAELALIGYSTYAAPYALGINDLVLRAGAYENHMFVLAVAKAGVEDGFPMIGGSCIVSPFGDVLARAATTDDELVTATIDLDQIGEAKRRWNFFARRHPEHYGAITAPVRETLWEDHGAAAGRR
jgi:predicted amidohydrolase